MPFPEHSPRHITQQYYETPHHTQTDTVENVGKETVATVIRNLPIAYPMHACVSMTTCTMTCQNRVYDVPGQADGPSARHLTQHVQRGTDV